jgi:hypothetical protein
LCVAGGIFQEANFLPPLGVLLSMPGHVLLPPDKRRYFGWLPAVLAAVMGVLSGTVVGLTEMRLEQIGMLVLFQGGVWQPLGGRCARWLTKKLSHYLIRRAMKGTLM